MDSFNPQAWHEIFSVGGTAAAALLGLVLVAISLHAREIGSHPLLRQRARTALQILGVLLFISMVALIPHLTAFWFGVATVSVNVLYLGLLTSSVITSIREVHGLPRIVWVRLSGNVISLVSIAGGISLMLGKGPGIYLQIPALTLVLPLSLYNVWILLFATELEQGNATNVD